MIMNGIKVPNCFEGIQRTDFYEKEISPYELPPKSNLNIGALSNYLAKTKKKLFELTKEEAVQFIV